MKEKNMYLVALKIGSDRIETGISYVEILDWLLKEGFKIEGHIEKCFRRWFFENFFNERLHSNLDNPGLKTKTMFDLTNNVGDLFELFKNDKMYLNAEGFFQLMDYEELNEARRASQESNENARKAITVAVWSIIITGILALFSILAQICHL
jgi:hypothetical protein